MKKKISFIGLLAACLLFLLAMPMTASAAETAGISYATHIQNIGWNQGWVSNGREAGTSGRSLRLEGIKIKLTGSYSGSIVYRTHIQNIGWQEWKKDGALSGTTGRSLRMEAIQIYLTGKIAKSYDVYYRVHVENFGWMGWAKNKQKAGTAGLSNRLEAIEIMLVKKGGDVPFYPVDPYFEINVKQIYNTYAESFRRSDSISCTVKLVDIDGNGMQEMLFVDKTSYNTVLRPCTINRSNGKVVYLCYLQVPKPNTPAIYYNRQGHFFGTWEGGTDRDQYSFFILKGTKLKDYMHFRRWPDAFEINGVDVSKSTYESKLKAILKTCEKVS